MAKRSSALGAILTFIGAYLSAAGLMGTIYLVQHGAPRKAGTFVFFLIGGLIAIALGYYLGSRAAKLPAPAPPPKSGSMTLGDWMRSQSIANAPPPVAVAATTPDSPSPRRSLSANTIALLVGLGVAMMPYLLSLLFRLLSVVSTLFPHSQGQVAMRWIMPSLMVGLVVWAIKRSIHNAGLRWNVAADRRYMAAYTLRLVVAFLLFWSICALPWVLLATSHPDEGTMTVIGWAGILWMPVVMVIAAFIALKVFRVWTITRD